MIKSYEDYYDSGYYDSRYSSPNCRTYQVIQQNLSRALLVDNELLVLDIGAGSGRYCIPLLHEFKALKVIAVEPCQKAQEILLERAQSSDIENRLKIYSDLSQVNDKHFHCILMIFGVLSHIIDASERNKLLQSTFDLLANSGHLVCTVPNIFRRFPFHVSQNVLKHRSLSDAGKITYKRHNGSRKLTLQYQLYSPSVIKNELILCGYRNVHISPESIMPESFVTGSSKISKIDSLLSSYLPSIMGYGLAAIAKK